MSDLKQIEQFVSARHACVIVPTREEGYARGLIEKVVAGTLYPMWRWSVLHGLRASLLEDALPIRDTEHPAAALVFLAGQVSDRTVILMHDLRDHLDDARTLRALRELITKCRATGSTLFLLDHRDSYPLIIEQESTRFEPGLPGGEELAELVKKTARKLMRNDGVEVKVTRDDFRTIVRNLRGLTRGQVERIVTDLCAADGRLDREDIDEAIAHKRRHLHRDGLLDFVETLHDLSEIGGLRKLKRWLEHREGALSEEAAAFGLVPPRGVLLLGVQGAGKSLSAKAIAAAWNRPLLRLDPGSLYDRYVGESERRLRQALHQAEMMAPIVLWIDEIEKGFASAAAQSTDGGLSQRMFGTLLTWMQEHEEPVFLVATANNIEALPPELLRKGRFDEIFFVDLPDEETRRIIFEIHLRKRDRDPGDFDVGGLAKQAAGFSGAEIEQAVVSGMHAAFGAGEKLETRHVAAAVTGSPPLSVTMAEKVAMLRRWAKDRCMPAG